MEQGETIEYKGWKLRVRKPEGEGPFPVLVMVHGLKGDETVMWIFQPRLPKNALIIAPRALYPINGGGYTWQQSDRAGLPNASELQPAASALHKLLDDLNTEPPDLWQKEQVDFEAVDLLGFSQGSAVAYLFALMYPECINRLGGLASFMPKGVETLVQREPLAGKKAFVAHGTKEETVPVSLAEDAVRQLEQAGAEVTLCLDDVGHKLSLDCFKGLGDFFRKSS